jgi:phage-related protein (TIGR01555 family)
MPKKTTKAKVKPLPKDSGAQVFIRQRGSKVVGDTYSNTPARMGDGTPNLENAGQYPLIRWTQNYPLILSLYRSSWMIRKVIDTVSNDMYQTFPVIDSELDPAQITQMEKVIRSTRVLTKLRTCCKWGRLFGGAGAIIILEGIDDLSTPLRLDDIELGSFKGLIPLDRWSGLIPGPEINSDISDPASFGLPTYYTATMDGGEAVIHHSRILRFTGRELPQWEVQTELYWGMSEVEILFDELKKRDYSSWNIVSLLTRAQVLSVEDPQLATLMSGAGGTDKAFNQFVNRMEAISQLLNNQGLLVLGKDGHLQQTSYSFGGISDVYHEFMKDYAAAAEMPYEMIFGREPGSGGGGNYSSNGQSSLQLYDNLIEQKRSADANPVIDQLLPIMCMSTWGFVPDDLRYHWSPIRSMGDQERYDLGKSLVESVLMAYNADLITKKEARKELAQQSVTHGLFSNITEQSIAETPDEFASDIAFEQQVNQMLIQANLDMQMGGVEGGGGGAGTKGKQGENIPTEAKPIGVQGLKWHRVTRGDGPGGKPASGGAGAGRPGASSKSSAKSIKQSMQHGVRHEMKAPK